jgi:hypothetical protein
MVYTVFMIPVVAIICVFTFVAIATWSENRRKEREAYYRSETHQKMLDGSPESADAVRALIREEEERRERRRAESLRMGLRLGGLITMVAGVGLAVFLYYLVDDDPVYLVGLIPLLIGLVLALYGFFMARPEPAGSGT